MIPPLTPAGPDSAVRRAAALRRAAVRAARAPSILDTQPWKLRIRGSELYVHADHRRQLPALDPQRRVLTMSVGCAVFAARAAMVADGYGVAVHRFPNPLAADLLAVLELEADVPMDTVDPVRPGSLTGALQAAVADEGMTLHVLDDVERELVAEVSRQADEIERLDPTYRAELDAWATHAHARDRVASAQECLAVLAADDDTPLDWLRAGEAVMRARQVAASAGHDVRPSTQVVEVSSARAQLRRMLGLTGNPQVLLRVGRGTGSPLTRRRLVDVLTEES